MKLPNREHSFIRPAKLNDYLLSEQHPVGRSKAKIQRSRGFNESNTKNLEEQLLVLRGQRTFRRSRQRPMG